jgi:threonine aldolase
MNFRSDNESPAAPEIMEAVVQANQGSAWAYAEDPWSSRLDQAFSALFETETTVIPVSTGTVANSIALASFCPPWGSVYCSELAHILNDESGAPEFYGHGMRLAPIAGEEGKISAGSLGKSVQSHERFGVHSYLPSAVSLTQSTEAGTVYTRDEITSITQVARGLGLAVHMDGARFGNAVASLACHPAEISWRAGIDMLSFGASKNGCMGAEALLLFGRPEKRDHAERLRKRGGHLLSKMRYVSAQLLAYIEDDLWLRLAAHSNTQAARFAQAVTDHREAQLEYPVQANEVFVRWSPGGFERLSEVGAQFLLWPGRNDLARFVFSHSTSDEETRKLCAALNG